jgi:DNA invertase Pin-like site-specific DNA recombinase
MNRAVIYARYSSEKQNEQSIEGQLRVCKEYAKRQNLKIVNSYIDRAQSGKDDDRKEFSKMMSDSTKDLFDYVIIYKLDRFSRNKYDSAVHNHTLKKNGVRRLSAMENITDGPEGVLMESILEGMAEYYSLELEQKVRRGIKENLLKGKTIGGNRLFGYTTENSKHVIVSSEADIVIKIYEMYLDGYTASEIVSAINLLGYSFNNNKVYRALKNKKYIGIYEHDDEVYTNIYPRIISDELFYKVQSRLNKNKKAPAARKAKVPYYLTGKLYCGKCGRPMNADSTNKLDKTYHYYTCNKSKVSNHKCSTGRISKTQIETIVANYVINDIITDKHFHELFKESIESYNEAIADNTKVKQLEITLKKTNKQIKNIVDTVKDGLSSSSLLQELSRLESLAEDMKSEIDKENLLTPSKIDDRIAYYLIKDFLNLSNKEKTTEYVLDAFVKKVIYDDDSVTIAINFNKELEYKITMDELMSSNLYLQGVPLDDKSNYMIYKGYIIYRFVF